MAHQGRVAQGNKPCRTTSTSRVHTSGSNYSLIVFAAEKGLGRDSCAKRSQEVVPSKLNVFCHMSPQIDIGHAPPPSGALRRINEVPQYQLSRGTEHKLIEQINKVKQGRNAIVYSKLRYIQQSTGKGTLNQTCPDKTRRLASNRASHTINTIPQIIHTC